MKKTIVALSGLFVLSACKSPDAPPAHSSGPTDEQLAAELWNSIQGYDNWDHFPGWDGWQESDSVHGNWVMTFVNTTDTNFPPGSIIVKEGFKKKDPETLRAITVMQRIEGYSEETGDWLNVRFDQGGNVTKINSSCVRCHEDAAGGDFVFLND